MGKYTNFILCPFESSINERRDQICDDVLQFDAEEGQWTKIGSMKISRYAHAVSVINYNSVKEYCK